MVFTTDSDLSYIYWQYKSEKVHGLFGLAWKKQGHTVKCNVKSESKKGPTFKNWPLVRNPQFMSNPHKT